MKQKDSIALRRSPPKRGQKEEQARELERINIAAERLNSEAAEVLEYQAKTHLSRLVQRVAAGEEITITKAGVAVARLVSVKPARAKRKLGLYRGQVWMAEDFDVPLPDEILASFRGQEPAPKSVKKKR